MSFAGLPLLSIVIFMPLLGVLFLLFMQEPTKMSDAEQAVQKRNCWSVAFLTTWTTFVLSVLLLFLFDHGESGYQFVERSSSLAQLRVSYCVGVDGMSLAFVLLTTFLMPLALKASVIGIVSRVKTYVIAFLVLETMMLGAFCALDIVYFYIFFEGVLIPMFLIIGIWGGERRIYSAFKFFLYTFFGSVLMLIAIIVMVNATHSSAINDLQLFHFDKNLQIYLWLAFFASFAVKVPMWPFHTWLPDAHVEAPTGGSVILAAILLKMGGYGFLRFSLPMFPDASLFFAPMVYALSAIAVIYASLVALVQTDMKKLIAYSSIAHMGIVTFGIFTFSETGIQGAIYQMISHGLVSGALFLCVGVLYDRVHSRDIQRYGGVARIMPVYAIVFMIFTFASIGLPGTSGFVGEIMVLLSSFAIGGWWTFALGLGIILGAAYGLWLYSRVMLKTVENEEIKKLSDLSLMERIYFFPLVLLVIVFGFYPKPVLDLTKNSVGFICSYFAHDKIRLSNMSSEETFNYGGEK